MNSKTRIGACVALMVCSTATRAQQTVDTSVAGKIDRYITARMRGAHIPGLALGIVKGDQVIYMHGYGQADSSRRSVTPQTPFAIGSITKSFTALAAFQLAEAGKINLDAPVRDYISWFHTSDSSASARITVRQLLTMTSGLPQVYETQVWSDQDAGALERGVRYLRTKAMRGPPGRPSGYSNANYETLGLIVQTVSGMSYEDYLKRSIFGPLSMRNTFTSQTEAMQHGMAQGHRWWFGVPVSITLPYNRAELPAGYIIASAEDMTHFLIAEINAGRYGNASVLSPDWMSLRHSQPPLRGYGYGWEFAESNGRMLLNHDGGTANFQSGLFIDPDARVGVFVATNADNALDTFSSPHGFSVLDGSTDRAIAQTVLSMVTGQPLPDAGPGHERLFVIFNITIVVLTAIVIAWLAWIPRRHRRLKARGIRSGSDLTWHICRAVGGNLTLPTVLLYLHFGVPLWNAFVLLQPDLYYWLVGVAIILTVKGLSEVLFVLSVAQQSRPAPTVSPATTRIVVAGGGIGGLAAARHLDHLLRDRSDVEITLVNRDNFFLLSPLLFEACSGVLELRHCAQPIRPCLRRVRFLEATVESIDVEGRVVRVVASDGAELDLPFDHVVVALGATTNLSVIRGSEHARTFKTVTDALLLRNHIIEQLERATVQRDPEARRRLLTVVVVGGGLVGVELLGEITAFMNAELRYYPQLRREDFRFHLFEAGDRLLPESKPFLANYAARTLQDRGVVLHIATAVQAIDPDRLRWANGEVQSPTIVLAAGITPSTVAAAMSVSRDRRGRIVTEPTLRSVSNPNVWAFGDCASTPAPDGKPYPALAQHAVRAAKVVARNVAATVNGGPLTPFVYEPLGLMAAFGDRHAAAEVKGINLSGFVAWWTRRTYYLFQMPRWDTRLRIAFDWTLSLIFRPDLTKINLVAARARDSQDGATPETERVADGETRRWRAADPHLQRSRSGLVRELAVRPRLDAVDRHHVIHF